MENKSNKYNKVVITILMIFIAGIIVANFILASPKFVITVEILICFSLLVILSLVEMFDNLSIPKIISLSKNMKELDKENKNLKETNIKLLEQITTIKNFNNQTIYLPSSFSTVGSSNIDDINKNEEPVSSNEQMESNNSNSISKPRLLAFERYRYKKNLDVFLLKKVLGKDDKFDIQYDVKLINHSRAEDNIMKNEARFDALKTDGNSNTFYEVKFSPRLIDYSYQLHYMLRTIELYQEFSKCSSKLVLILPKMDKELANILFPNMDTFCTPKARISYQFEPAIRNNLLEIMEVDISKEELDKYIKEKD